MTAYVWSSMSPRERDALVAEKVMQWDVYTKERPHPQYELDEEEVAIGFPPDKPSQGSWDVPYEIPEYTESISAAWEVVEKMKPEYTRYSEDFIQLITTDSGWHCEFTQYKVGPEDYTTRAAEAKTAPEAICLAALRAVGVEIQ